MASCDGKNQCGIAKGHQPLLLTPLMANCESDLKFKLSGLLEGKTEQAKAAIITLNLGDKTQHNRFLVKRRKELIATLLREYNVTRSESNAVIQMVIDDINTPIEGKLQPFSPVLTSILKDWLD